MARVCRGWEFPRRDLRRQTGGAPPDGRMACRPGQRAASPDVARPVSDAERRARWGPGGDRRAGRGLVVCTGEDSAARPTLAPFRTVAGAAAAPRLAGGGTGRVPG